MPLTVKRRDRQSPDQLQVEFNRRTTRFVKSQRNSRYRIKTPNKLKRKTKALISARLRAAKERKKFYE
jgi:hypothetical protein